MLKIMTENSIWVHFHLFIELKPNDCLNYTFLNPFKSKKVSTTTLKKLKSLRRVQLFAISWTIQSMEFSRPEYWNGQPFLSPGDLPNPGIEPGSPGSTGSPASQADALPSEPPGKHGLYSPWNSPGQNTGMGSLSFLQGIFLTQGLNPGLPALQVDSLPAEPPGKPKKTEQPIPSPADLPNPGIELGSPAQQADSLPTELSVKPRFKRTDVYLTGIVLISGVQHSDVTSVHTVK